MITNPNTLNPPALQRLGTLLVLLSARSMTREDVPVGALPQAEMSVGAFWTVRIDNSSVTLMLSEQNADPYTRIHTAVRSDLEEFADGTDVEQILRFKCDHVRRRFSDAIMQSRKVEYRIVCTYPGTEDHYIVQDHLHGLVLARGGKPALFADLDAVHGAIAQLRHTPDTCYTMLEPRPVATV